MASSGYKNPRELVATFRIEPEFEVSQEMTGFHFSWRYATNLRLSEYLIFLAVRSGRYETSERIVTCRSTSSKLLLQKIYQGPENSFLLRWKDVEKADMYAYGEPAIVLRILALCGSGYIPSTEFRFSLGFLLGRKRKSILISCGEETSDGPVSLQSSQNGEVIIPGMLYLVPKLLPYSVEACVLTRDE